MDNKPQSEHNSPKIHQYFLNNVMKVIGIILILISIIFGVFGVRSYLRDDAYAKTSTIVKASVKFAEVKLMSGKAVGSIRMVLIYMHDGVADSIEHNFSQDYSNNNPLPTVEELKTASLYVRYVPKEKRTKTTPNWVLVSKNEEFEGWYGRSSFKQMFTFILLGFMVRIFGRKRSNKILFQ
ncbi:hypothetical protein MASR2M47_45340 [Draconibacterium sp.]